MRGHHPLAKLIILCLAACGGDDSQGRRHDVGNTADSGQEVSSEALGITVSAPAEGALLTHLEQVTVSAAVSGGASFDQLDVTLEVDDYTAPNIQVQPSGLVSTRVSVASGAHTLKLTVRDAQGKSATATRAFVVNTPPVVEPHVPSETTTDFPITASADIVDDTIGDGGLTVTYEWRHDGDPDVLVSTAELSSALTERGESYTVTVIANDGFGPGEPATATVHIINSVPVCSSVVLTPSSAGTDRDLTCSCLAFDDMDGDANQSTCTFFEVGNETVISEGPCVLPASLTEAGMVIGCRLVPFDGEGEGEAILTSPGQSATINGSAPTAPVARLTPESGSAMTTFSCELETASTDPDGDSISYTAGWMIAGSASGGTTSTTIEPGELGGHSGDTVCCTLTAADDGGKSSVSEPACAMLTNTAPELGNVFVRVVDDHDPATRRDTLVCAPEDVHDADGDTLTYIYAWSVGGGTIDASGATLDLAGIPRDARVSCTVTVCDAELCTDAQGSKNNVTVANATPIVEGVSIDAEDAQVDDTLTCSYAGIDDPDGDPQTVSYRWLATDASGTQPIDGDGNTLVVTEDIAPGTVITCEVTANDGIANGVPVASDDGVLILAATPVPPVVTLVAPDGANGDLTCSITSPGQYIPAAATRTFMWSVNGAAEIAGGATLDADTVLDCDRVTCRQAITTTALTLSSNTASVALPPGLDCDDGNPCTAAVCRLSGGCNSIVADGPSCDDGDPCTDQETCSEGACVGTVDTCVEDRLNLGPSANRRPYVAATPDGGYVTQWFGDSDGEAAARVTNKDETRVGDEVATTPAATSGPIASAPAVLSDGTIVTLRNASRPYYPYNNPVQVPYGIYAWRWDAALGAHDEVAVGQFAVTSSLAPQTWGAYGPNRMQAIAFADNSLAWLGAYSNAYVRSGITFRTLTPDGVLGTPKTLVAGTAMYEQDKWHATLVPDGSDAFVLAWADQSQQAIYVQRFSRAGDPELGDPIAVANAGGTVRELTVVTYRSGRFVVVWDADNADGSGRGIMAQRFDESGNKLGATFGITQATAGDQLLGDADALRTPSEGFVVAWRDGGGTTAHQRVRIFTTAGVGGAAIEVDEATAVAAHPPAVAALVGGDFVVAWVDTQSGLWTRRYDADGEATPAVAELRANDETYATQETPSAARAASGNVMVAYTSRVYPSASAASEIVAHVFDADGLEVSPEQIINEHLDGAQTTPVVAGGGDAFVVAWDSEGEDGSGEGIIARRFDDVGAPDGASFVVTETVTDFQRQPAVVMNAGGDVVFAWNGAVTTAGSSSDVFMRVFPKGGVAGSELRVNDTVPGPQERPAIALVPFADEALVAWQTKNGTSYDIAVRKVAFGGTASPEVVITTTTGDQRNPTIAALASGSFVVCWESSTQGPSNLAAIVCQRVKTSTLVPQGGEYLVDPFAGAQTQPVARFLGTGRLAVAWTSPIDGSNTGIALARLNDLGQSVAPGLVVNRTTANAQERPWLVVQDAALWVGWQSLNQASPTSEGDIFFRILPTP